MSTDQITHNRVARLAADLTPASFACLVIFDIESKTVSITATSGTSTRLFKQTLASASRAEPQWKSSSPVSLESNAKLSAVFVDRSTVEATAGEFAATVISDSLLKSTFARFSDYWCLATPLIVSETVHAALMFFGPKQFTKSESEKCLAFAEQSQRSISSMVIEREITDEIERLSEKRRQVQMDDPIGLTQRRNGTTRTPRSFGDIRLSLDTKVAMRGGRDLGLTRIEFDLLDTFLQSPGTALSRVQIISRVWVEKNGVSSNTLSVTIKNLREKLEFSNEQRVIHSIRGFGYVLRAQ